MGDSVIEGLLQEWEKAQEQHKRVTGQAKIWRYMDFAKFVSLLSTKTLWFARADRLQDDPLEAVSEVIPYIAPVEPNPGEQIYSVAAEAARRQLKDLNKKIFINCWTKREDQSTAMWKLYATHERGVAIQSRVQRLDNAIKLPDGVDRQQLHLAAVEYVPTDTRQTSDLARFVPFPLSEVMKPAFMKRACFDHEHEWRAALLQWNPDLTFRDVHGIDVSVDIEELIEDVWVSPVAERFFKDAVEWVMSTQGLKREAKKLEWPSSGRSNLTQSAKSFCRFIISGVRRSFKAAPVRL